MVIGFGNRKMCFPFKKKLSKSSENLVNIFEKPIYRKVGPLNCVLANFRAIRVGSRAEHDCPRRKSNFHSLPNSNCYTPKIPKETFWKRKSLLTFFPAHSCSHTSSPLTFLQRKSWKKKNEFINCYWFNFLSSFFRS